MSNTTIILEALFTGADEAECKRRDEIAPKIIAQDWLDMFLKRNDIKKNEDGSYDVNGDVDCAELRLTRLPIKFGIVTGDFDCAAGDLTTLEGCPRKIGKSFTCLSNDLTSLEHGPVEVGGNYNCAYNPLTSLVGLPKKINGTLHINNLTKLNNKNLEGCPTEVTGSVWANNNLLTSLKGAPKRVGYFCCGNNKLTSLAGAPEIVTGGFDCSNNSILFTRAEVYAASLVGGSIYV